MHLCFASMFCHGSSYSSSCLSYIYIYIYIIYCLFELNMLCDCILIDCISLLYICCVLEFSPLLAEWRHSSPHARARVLLTLCSCWVTSLFSLRSTRPGIFGFVFFLVSCWMTSRLSTRQGQNFWLCRSSPTRYFFLFIGALKAWFVPVGSVASSCRALSLRSNQVGLYLLYYDTAYEFHGTMYIFYLLGSSPPLGRFLRIDGCLLFQLQIRYIAAAGERGAGGGVGGNVWSRKKDLELWIIVCWDSIAVRGKKKAANVSYSSSPSPACKCGQCGKATLASASVCKCGILFKKKEKNPSWNFESENSFQVWDSFHTLDSFDTAALMITLFFLTSYSYRVTTHNNPDIRLIPRLLSLW